MPARGGTTTPSESTRRSAREGRSGHRRLASTVRARPRSQARGRRRLWHERTDRARRRPRDPAAGGRRRPRPGLRKSTSRGGNHGAGGQIASSTCRSRRSSGSSKESTISSGPRPSPAAGSMGSKPPRSHSVNRAVADQDLLRRTKEEIRTRVKELEPLVKEHERLRRALEALEASAQAASPSRRRAGGRRRRPASARRAGRGERRQQLLKLLATDPGLRPSEAAHRLSINPSQVHSLAKRLEEEGSLERQEGRLYPSGRS
jgi:hypothetical protein